MEQKVRELLDELLQNRGIRPEDIPNIELYMDQVTTFMDEHLSGYKRYPEDKVLTKTMINNYTKNRLLPPSNKKKYSKEHVFLLIMIYYYKSILSISDIQNLMSTLTETYFPRNPENDLSMKDIYSKLMEQMEESKPDTEQEILKSLEKSTGLFASEEMSDEEEENLVTFTFISQLCYDIYLRKQLIEKLLDLKCPPDKGKKKKEK